MMADNAFVFEFLINCWLVIERDKIITGQSGPYSHLTSQIKFNFHLVKYQNLITYNNVITKCNNKTMKTIICKLKSREVLKKL